MRRVRSWLDRPMAPLGFLFIAAALPVSLSLASAAIVFFRVPISNNQLVLNQQLEKISASPSDVTTMIIGDSSAGNGVDAVEFHRLTGERTINLALTGSFGLLNNLILAQRATEHLPQIKNIIFIATAANWQRPFSPDGYYLLINPLHRSGKNPIGHLPEAIDAHSRMFGWLVTPKRVSWFLSSLTGEKDRTWSFEFDYLAQSARPVKPPKNWLRSVRPFQDNAIALIKREIERWCTSSHASCFVLAGPLFEGSAARSPVALAQLRNYFQHFNCNSTARWNGEVLSLPFEYIGDTQAHVHPSRKKEVTGIYAKRYAELRENKPACPEHG